MSTREMDNCGKLIQQNTILFKMIKLKLCVYQYDKSTKHNFE